MSTSRAVILSSETRNREPRMTALLPILIVIALVVALDLVALRFGADSRDRLGSSSRDVLR